MNILFRRLRNYRVILAVALIFLPIILFLLTGEWRKSISDYAYANNTGLLPTFLGLASIIFILDTLIDRTKWYSAVLGISLLCVGLTPHNDYEILHYISASIFFFGSVFVMIYYSSKKQRFIKIILGGIIIIGVILPFLTTWYSVLVGEWIALIPIALHYIGEALNKLD